MVFSGVAAFMLSYILLERKIGRGEQIRFWFNGVVVNAAGRLIT
jgi:hypothetical protein